MAPIRILLTGADGQLGFELRRVLAGHGEVHATTRSTLDLGEPDAIVAAVRALAPRLIVNAAAYTAVDRAQTESELAYRINARAPEVLAEEARRAGAVLVHFSTDYVFDGERSTPYPEDAPTRPLNVYGASKLAGEQAIAHSGAAALVFRTSWVYGARGSNFLLTIRRLAAQREELRIVADQTGVPNWVRTLAQAIDRIVGGGTGALAERKGVYHLCSAGQASWYDFARAIVGAAPTPRVVPITTSQYPLPARRPKYAVLDTHKFADAFGFALPPWRTELERCLKALGSS